MKSIDVWELSEKLKSGAPIVLIDIREDYEYDFFHIDCLHISMSDILLRVKELDNKKETYLLCNTGKRSSAVANFLSVNHNFLNVSSVEGGIEMYVKEIIENQ